MKKIIKKFWGLALVVVMLTTLFVAATPASAADPLQWNRDITQPSGIPGIIFTQYANTDILDFAVSGDGMTFYAVMDTTNGGAAGTASALLKGSFGGALWSDLTSATNNRLSNTNLYTAGPPPVTAISFVAISPDNPDVIVVAGIGPVTATWQAAASTDGGLNFYDMGTIQGWGTNPIATANDLDVSPISSGNVYYVAIAGDDGVNPAIYYYNLGSVVGSWRDAVNDWGVGGVTPLGTSPYVSWAATLPIAVTPVSFRTIQFSTNFGSDFTFMALSEDTVTSGVLWLHIASLASHKWDADLNMTLYPVNVEDDAGGGITAVNAASIAMGPEFMGIEEETVITFVGASCDDALAAEVGGIYRIDDSAAVTKIREIAINSITFDGTTLAAGSYDTNNVWRVLDVTVASPVARSARSIKRMGIDDTGANDMVIVHFAGENLFGSKRGDASALSKSTDYGYTWNDFTLMDSSNTVIDDIYMLPDGSAWYMAANDWFDPDGAGGVIGEGEASIYRMAGGVTQRVLCVDMVTLANPAFATSGPQFMLRGIPGDADVIYAADKGTYSNDVYVSADGGVNRWSRKTTFPGVAINDMAVESATVVYIADGVLAYKSTNSGSLWGEGVDTGIGGGIFNMISLGDGNLVIGGQMGGVNFSTDGGATWTATMGIASAEMAPVYVAATGVGPTDTIFVASSASLNVYNGPAAFLAEFKSMNVPAINTPAGGTADPGSVNSGIAYVDGILYVLETFNDGDQIDELDPLAAKYPGGNNDWDATYVIHSMTPTASPHTALLWGTRYPDNYDAAYTSASYNMDTAGGSALHYVKTANSVKLYGIDAGGAMWLDMNGDGDYLDAGPPPDMVVASPAVYYYEDIVSLPSAAPVLRTPTDENLFEIVSAMLADAELVSFTWDRAHPKITSYQLWIALDEGFTELVPLWNNVAGAWQAPIPVASPSDIVAIIATRGAFDPGRTYYWKVNVLTPFNGVFSETRSFTIAPSAATVPVIAAPANGATDVGSKPAFSWSPVTGCTMYEFQLSEGTAFAVTLVSEQVATTAIQITTALEEGKTYFWRVRAVSPVQSEWSAIGNFTVAVPEEPPAPPVTITQQAPPQITITTPAPAPPVTLAPPVEENIAPAYIWAIIIIGAVLVIAVIVLIVRTRRSV